MKKALMLIVVILMCTISVTVYASGTETETKNVKIVPKGYWIAINKTTNKLTLYNGKKVSKVYRVATGSNPSYTPEGKFYIKNKIANPYWGGGSGRYTPILGGAPNNPLGEHMGGTKYGIHGTNREDSIGQYKSRGCIRMRNKEVKELSSLVKINTPVWIGTTKRLKLYGVPTS